MIKKNVGFICLFFFICVLAAVVFNPGTAGACTTILVTKGATTDGSMIVAHSDDDELGDQRIIYVPAMDHKPGSKRPIYPFGSNYPRLVSKSRGPGYDIHGYPETKPLGYIDQVPHTYAYIDGNYGIMNEHQLLIGECTDAAWKNLPPAKGRIDIAELSRIALERCKKARRAIKLMGKLAVELGYYGWGETLLVADTEEGWIFEICAVPGGNSALWVAKKVPDGTIFVAANQFRIRDVDPGDSENMIYSPNLFTKTKDLGWQKRSANGKLDWLRTVSPGEYFHPYYSLRRVWRAFCRITKKEKELSDCEFPAWVKDAYTRAYPFSVKPYKKYTPRDVMALYRDYYEKTPFDMTKDLAAGPFGDPNRYVSPDDPTQNVPGDNKKGWGAWERPISMYYMGYSYVCQARQWMPDIVGGIAWIGLDVAYTTCYMPFYPGAGTLPWSFQTGSTGKFDRKVAWWAFNFVTNWAGLKFSYMTKDICYKQEEIENQEFDMQPVIEKTALGLYKKNSGLACKYLTCYTDGNAANIVDQWWQLAEKLIVKYDDGYIHVPPAPAQEVAYPKWWRKKVGYEKGPLTYKKPKK